MKIFGMINCMINYVIDSQYRFNINVAIGLYEKMDDTAFLKKAYANMIGKKLILTAPATFNEKLQWLKLNDHNPEYTVMVDKYLARKYVEERIGKEYLIPLIGVWNSPCEINFADMPNTFVLKCNHNSGLGMCICRDKDSLNINKVAKSLYRGIRQNYYLVWREWPYKDVPRKIIAEKYLETAENDLPDYKFHCFNGKVKIILVCRNRFGKEGMTEDFYDENWTHLNITRPGYCNSTEPIQRPQKLDEMITLAEKLSQNIPFLRVDLYYVDNKIYFGELTFFPSSGFTRFLPSEWDDILGSYLQLPKSVIDIK